MYVCMYVCKLFLHLKYGMAKAINLIHTNSGKRET